MTAFDLATPTLQRMNPDGAFLTASDGAGHANPMVISWGGMGILWNKKLFFAPVRTTRFTHDLLEKHPYFTVSVPGAKALKEALAFCGSKSGRDYDKWKECALSAEPGRAVPVPVVGGCELFYECKVIYKQTLDDELLKAFGLDRHYPLKDFHTLYWGEILAQYSK